MATTITKPVVLSWANKDNTIMVEPEDEDRFFVTVEEAIRACGAHGQGKKSRCQEQFRTLRETLFLWAREQSKMVNKAFITVQDHGLLFLVITHSKKFDREFEDKLTDLDLQIARSDDFSEIDLSVQSLPDCNPDNYQSFCDPDFTLELKIKD